MKYLNLSEFIKYPISDRKVKQIALRSEEFKNHAE